MGKVLPPGTPGPPAGLSRPTRGREEGGAEDLGLGPRDRLPAEPGAKTAQSGAESHDCATGALARDAGYLHLAGADVVDRAVRG